MATSTSVTSTGHAARPRVVRDRVAHRRRVPAAGARASGRGRARRARARQRRRRSPARRGTGRRLAVGVAAQRLVAGVRARVPAPLREVEAADERDGVVDDDHLLVVRRADRMARVEAEREPPVRAPVELVEGQPFALERVEHREVPAQHVGAQALAARDDRVEEFPERLRESRRPRLRGTSRMRLSMSQPRMKIEWRAATIASRTARKYASPSTRNDSRAACSMRQQLRPARSSGARGFALVGRRTVRVAHWALQRPSRRAIVVDGANTGTSAGWQALRLLERTRGR